ncbi:hypothetical protein INT46_005583 [Mucor plumbeus]|uniref:Uncharacterized protein n=1 Tax=Mucor plumbeus TaxID=97098 RepID=A0A8H7QCP6_9FUNG|nr:hypothetical protein INT46_005583 [Mucor plumbeus]
MSKRANETQELVSENKRSRSTNVTEGHSSDCTDDLCKGCDVGEVEISFVRKDANGKPIDTEPSAQELLAMALDEASNDKNNDNEDENNGIARRLFDMAIEKYQKDEPENRVGYAACLVELGKAIQVEESISEGLEVLRGELLKRKDDRDVLLKAASAAIALATSIRKKQEAYFEQQEAELEGSDGEMDEVAFNELVKKQELSKNEINLYKEAIDRINEAFIDIGEEDEAILKEAQSVMHEMRGYGQLLVQPFHEEHSNTVLNSVISLIQKLPDYEKNDELLTLWAACLLHQEKFLEEKEKKVAILKKADELLIKSNKLFLAKNGKENPWVWEMYAMLRINQSNLADDEDQALDLYDEAILAFKKASALSPDNPKLSEMVNMLQALQDGAELEGEEEEDVEDEE